MGKFSTKEGAVSGGEDSCQGDSGGPIFDRKVLRGRKDWIDATVCELSSSHPTSRGDGLPGTLETMDTPGYRWYFGPDQSTGSFSTEGGAVSKTAS
jgi:hypothetical protein